MLLREDLVYYSILRKLKEELPEFGYVLAPEEKADLLVREAWPTPEERTKELTINTLALSLAVDDGGRDAELGSTLTEYRHTIEGVVFGLELSFAFQVAQAVKHILRESDDAIPLLDFSQEGDPQIDTLRIDKVQVKHLPNNAARPWDQYVYGVACVVTDTYYI